MQAGSRSAKEDSVPGPHQHEQRGIRHDTIRKALSWDILDFINLAQLDFKLAALRVEPSRSLSSRISIIPKAYPFRRFLAFSHKHIVAGCVILLFMITLSHTCFLLRPSLQLNVSTISLYFRRFLASRPEHVAAADLDMHFSRSYLEERHEGCHRRIILHKVGGGEWSR